MKTLLPILFLLIPLLSIGQTYTTTSAGDIESPSTWQNGEVPPFNIIDDVLEIPDSLTLYINDGLSTSKSEIVNRGVVNISLSDSDYPSLNWRNFGNLTIGGAGWGITNTYFINEESGKMLFQAPGLFCHHLGCGSENYGLMYIKGCTSNMCGGEDGHFINHETGIINICDSGYLENYWYVPNVGSSPNVSNLGIQNDGTIALQNSTNLIYSEGNDYFNNNPNSMGFLEGNGPTNHPDIVCVAVLPALENDPPEPPTSIELTDSQMTIYPNPSQGNITINTNTTYDKVRLTDVSGRTVYEASFQANNIHPNLAEGIYLIHLINNEKIIAQEKLLIVK